MKCKGHKKYWTIERECVGQGKYGGNYLNIKCKEKKNYVTGVNLNTGQSRGEICVNEL